MLYNGNFAKKKKKKTGIFILISVLIIGVISLVIVFSIKKSKPNKENSQKPNSENPGKKPEIPPSENPPLPEENNECPYLKEQNLTTANSENQKNLKMCLQEKELPQWKAISKSFIIECWKKGYHWHDIIQLWDWKIPIQDIPNLKSEKSIGVMNSLHYLIGIPTSILYDESIPEEQKLKMMEDDSVSGFVANLVVIIRKKSPHEPSLNLDKKIPEDGPFGSGNTRQYIQNLINLFIQQEKLNSNQYQISLLECLGVEYFNQEADIKYGVSYGKSAGSAIYLALLSAFHKKNISRQLAATGSIATKTKKFRLNGSEIELPLGTNLPIGGIKGKTIGATKKGINCLVLSKFQTGSNSLSFWKKREQKWIENSKENNYQAVVPTETKSKIKEIHWTENIQELKNLILQGKLE